MSPVCTYLSEAPEEHVEAESMCAVRHGQGREDGELSQDPDHADANTRGDLSCDVLRARAVFVDRREDAEANHTSSPAEVVLRTVALDGLDGPAGDDSCHRNSERQGEDVDTRANRGCVADSLEVDRQVVWRRSLHVASVPCYRIALASNLQMAPRDTMPWKNVPR